MTLQGVLTIFKRWGGLAYFLYLFFPQRGYNNVLGSVALRNKLIDVENAIKVGLPKHNNALV